MVMEILDDVYWVGVVDWDLRHFHGHELSTHRGSSYNAYLILDEKPTLVDTVWGPFQDEFIENISRVIDPAKIEIVVANHAETDHSGGLPAVMRYAPNATVVTSRRGAQSVQGHYHQPWNFKPVVTGDKINIGKSDLVFVEAPMLHWPDSMFTYLTGRNLLMPNDAFGQHYATAFRFNDQVNQKELYEEALKYYVNILTPFSAQVIREDRGDHAAGAAHRHDRAEPRRHLARRAAADRREVPRVGRAGAEPSAVILYDTMWQGTRRMAEAIGDGLADEGVDHKLLHVAVTDRNDALVEVFQSADDRDRLARR